MCVCREERECQYLINSYISIRFQYLCLIVPTYVERRSRTILYSIRGKVLSVYDTIDTINIIFLLMNEYAPRDTNINNFVSINLNLLYVNAI